ncbi:hypothetical protein N7481_011955 [Penicillium waksmanii]|uniref:uncharacterized protein n=1 Tax=Penicillium waksmanii TaxID=69791 RepID=UPI0025478C1B|nr:uncharacterized protein N7481_011955 [Penicillium waksmanii]KAJ5965241.1 hypothetical protein N7481_011955 [Penicillium waksmanii]
MKAIVIEKFGGTRDVAQPEPEIGWVVIRVKAFGVNHAEMHMRKGEWAEWTPISGIECVGIVAACPGGEFAEGTMVASVMGGLGRTISGSYAEFTRAQVSNVVALGPAASDLPWDQLAAIPETYATAWTCLFRNLELSKGQKLLIRGGTSAFGRAAINLAVHAGAHVFATTRNGSRVAQLTALGVEKVVIEGQNLSERFTEKFDAILELVGNSTVVDSLKMVHRGGRMASGVHFSFFGSFAFGTPEFPLSDVPLQDVVKMAASEELNAKPWKVFKFEDIHEAHRLMENSDAQGKMVVLVD